MSSFAYYSGPESPLNPVYSTWLSSGGSRPCKVPWRNVRRNIQTKHKGIRQAAYTTIVRPQLEYAFPVWSPYTQTNINKIEAVQRRAARWVSNDYSSYSNLTQMINTLGLRSLEQICADARLIMFYKMVYILWFSWDFFATIHSAPCQNHPEYAPISVHTADPFISKLLQILILSFGYCAVEQPPFFGCPFWWPDYVRVYHLQLIHHIMP